MIFFARLLFNAGLVFSLLLMLFLVFHFTARGTLALPRYLYSPLVSALMPSGVTLESGEGFLHSSFGISLKKGVLRIPSSYGPVSIQFEHLDAGLEGGALSLRCTSASAVLASDESNSWCFMDQLFADLLLAADSTVHIKALDFNLAGIPVSARGHFKPEQLKIPADTVELLFSVNTSARKLYEAFEKEGPASVSKPLSVPVLKQVTSVKEIKASAAPVSRLAEKAQSLSKQLREVLPGLRLRVQFDTRKGELWVSAPRLDFPVSGDTPAADGGLLSLERPQLHFTLPNDEQGSPELDFSSAGLSWAASEAGKHSQNMEARSVLVCAKTESPGSEPRLRLHVCFSDARIHGFPVNTLLSRVTLSEDLEAKIDVEVLSPQNRLAIAVRTPSCRLDPNGKALADEWARETVVQVVGELQLAALTPYPLFAALASKDYPQVNGPLHLEVQGGLLQKPQGRDLKSLLEALELEGECRFESFTYGDLTIQSGYTELHLKGTTLAAKNLSLTAADYSVQGAYWQDLGTRDYRITLKGRLRPLDLRQIIDESWWDDLWARFTFDAHLPVADMDLKGRYGGGRAFKWMFLTVSIDEFLYNQYPLRGFESTVFMLPDTLTLYNMQIKGYTGEAKGILQFTAEPSTGHRLFISSEVRSTLPLKTFCGIIGDDAMEVAELFSDVEEPVINGMAFIDERVSPEQAFARVDAHFPEPLEFYGVGLDSLHFSGVSLPERIIVRQAQARLGRGTIHAEAVLQKQSGERVLSGQLQLQGTEYRDLQRSLAKIMESDKKADKAGQSEKNETYDGVVNADLGFSGKTGALENFTVKGQIALAEARLASLRFFFLLSDALRLAGIPFGTLDFDSAQATVDMRRGYLGLPEIEISGPTAAIQSTGYINLKDDSSHFKARLLPFGAVSQPIFSQVLNTVGAFSRIIEIDMKGSFSDPEWSIRLAPLGLFSEIETLSPPE